MPWSGTMAGLYPSQGTKSSDNVGPLMHGPMPTCQQRAASRNLWVCHVLHLALARVDARVHGHRHAVGEQRGGPGPAVVDVERLGRVDARVQHRPVDQVYRYRARPHDATPTPRPWGCTGRTGSTCPSSAFFRRMDDIVPCVTNVNHMDGGFRRFDY
jgi:hypothetical protein